MIVCCVRATKNRELLTGLEKIPSQITKNVVFLYIECCKKQIIVYHPACRLVFIPSQK
jgi:hypothetical protein